jgi:hypothetical protein
MSEQFPGASYSLHNKATSTIYHSSIPSYEGNNEHKHFSSEVKGCVIFGHV